jgi:NAD(P)H-dependent flavin oxidoreductase YrpB (nitropropane dioxygenase family)
MSKRVLVECRDLLFRGKIQAILGAAGAEPTRGAPFDLAVVELGKPGVEQRVRDLVQQGIPVLAFGAHVDAEALRAARSLGARAVPNSEVETALRALL